MPIPLDGGGFEVPTAHGQRGLQGQCNQHDEVGLDGQTPHAAGDSEGSQHGHGAGSAVEPLVVNRFHATRSLTGEIEATTLPMLLDIGLRSQAADKAWGLLRDLRGSAVWLAAGVNIRPDKLQRRPLPLPQRLATMQAKSQWWS